MALKMCFRISLPCSLGKNFKVQIGELRVLVLEVDAVVWALPLPLPLPSCTAEDLIGSWLVPASSDPPSPGSALILVGRSALAACGDNISLTYCNAKDFVTVLLASLSDLLGPSIIRVKYWVNFAIKGSARKSENVLKDGS